MNKHRVTFLSVLLPTYNLSHYLGCAISSILCQSYKNFELLIIDDGSTDNTTDIVHSFNDSRIKYLYKRHTGLSDTMNYGLRLAKSDWIAIMEADDIAVPLRFEKEIKILNENKDYSVVSCSYAVFMNSKILYIVQNSPHHDQIIKQMALHSPICNQGVIYNKELVTRNGGYDTKKREYDLWLRIKDDAKFYNITEPLMLVRRRKDSLTNYSISQHKRIVYESQKPFYIKGLDKEFDIHSEKEQINVKNWREWFYGSKKEARNCWLNKPVLLLNPKILVAFFLTFLSQSLLTKFQLIRLKYRLLYVFVKREIKGKLEELLPCP